MSEGLERLKQRDEQTRRQETPGTSDAMMTTLTSILDGVESQNRRIERLAERQEELARFVQTMDQESDKQIDRMERRLRTSITSLSAPTPSGSETSGRSELHEIGTTLSTLADAIDGKQITDATTSLTTAAQRIERTTAWNSERAGEFVSAYEAAMRSAGRSIYKTRDEAVTAIRQSSSLAADTATAHVDEAVDRVRAATESAERVVGVAERLAAPLGWAAAARMGLALLPVAVVLLMVVQTVWALVVGVRWALSQDWDLWLNITAGTALLGLVAGAGYGLWLLSAWMKISLDDAARQKAPR